VSCHLAGEWKTFPPTTTAGWGQRAAKRLRGAGRKDGASVKEINGLKIGKVNMSWAIACPGTGRLPRTNLFYAGPGRGQ